MGNQQNPKRDWEREKEKQPGRGGEHEWKQPGQGRDKERPQQPGKKSC